MVGRGSTGLTTRSLKTESITASGATLAFLEEIHGCHAIVAAHLKEVVHLAHPEGGQNHIPPRTTGTVVQPSIEIAQQ